MGKYPKNSRNLHAAFVWASHPLLDCEDFLVIIQLTVLGINVLNYNNQQDNNQSSRSLYNQFYFILVHLPRSSCFPSSYQYVPWILLLLHIFSPKPPTPSNHIHVQFNQKHFFNNWYTKILAWSYPWIIFNRTWSVLYPLHQCI